VFDQAEPFVSVDADELEAVLDLASWRWLALVAELLGRFPASSGPAMMTAAALAGGHGYAGRPGAEPHCRYCVPRRIPTR
jgi:hypothetical protein